MREWDEVDMRHLVTRLLLTIALVAACGVRSTNAQLDFEGEPINYLDAPSSGPVAQLQKKIDSGQLELKYDERHGYLPAVLDALEIPYSSQMLVFSQTSFQLRKISRQRPRAVYFNDDVYIGWVQGGDVVEVSSMDPKLGAVFYTLSQDKERKVKFLRDRGQCLTCHASSRTQGVPGQLVRSVFPDASGRPMLGSGTFTTDHTSPFSERWGGWFVTGSHGSMRHMGNVYVADKLDSQNIDREKGANVQKLDRFVDTSPYLVPTSDLVALMVLEHQSQMHNFITLAHMETRLAQHYDAIMNKALDREPDFQSDSTKRRIKAVSDKLVRYMLFSEEFPLESPVKGVSSFTQDFMQRGPRDSRGRSLRDFDLQHRLFKYPCSYLIYSKAFQTLPKPVMKQVMKSLDEILTAETPPDGFAHLSPADRKNIREILVDTLPQLTADWN